MVLVSSLHLHLFVILNQVVMVRDTHIGLIQICPSQNKAITAASYDRVSGTRDTLAAPPSRIPPRLAGSTHGRRASRTAAWPAGTLHWACPTSPCCQGVAESGRWGSPKLLAVRPVTQEAPWPTARGLANPFLFPVLTGLGLTHNLSNIERITSVPKPQWIQQTPSVRVTIVRRVDLSSFK